MEIGNKRLSDAIINDGSYDKILDVCLSEKDKVAKHSSNMLKSCSIEDSDIDQASSAEICSQLCRSAYIASLHKAEGIRLSDEIGYSDFHAQEYLREYGLQRYAGIKDPQKAADMTKAVCIKKGIRK